MPKTFDESQIEIVALPPSEWQAYRDARLRALSQDPPAFLRTYSESVALPEETWRARLQSVADGHDWLLFARAGGAIVGMMGAYRPGPADASAVIWGVHVDRAARGRAIGARLMAHLLDTLRQAGISRVTLNVNTEQRAAVALYEKFGFAVIAEETLRLSEGRQDLDYRMERDL